MPIDKAPSAKRGIGSSVFECAASLCLTAAPTANHRGFDFLPRFAHAPKKWAGGRLAGVLRCPLRRPFFVCATLPPLASPCPAKQG